MSFLDSIFGGVWDNLFVGGRSDRRLARLVEEGEVAPATIYAIRILPKGDSADEYYYGLDVAASDAPFRASVRQQLAPEPERARLGSEVLVRHLDVRVAIDWPGTLERAGVPTKGAAILAIKTLREPLPPGIDDRRLDHKRLERGRRTTAELVAAERAFALGMPLQNWDLDLLVDEENASPRQVSLSRKLVPPYAVHLLEAGTRLPVAVDLKRPDRVTVDWAAAAEAAAAVA